jgi:hypothetical protein
MALRCASERGGTTTDLTSDYAPCPSSQVFGVWNLAGCASRAATISPMGALFSKPPSMNPPAPPPPPPNPPTYARMFPPRALDDAFGDIGISAVLGLRLPDLVVDVDFHRRLPGIIEGAAGLKGILRSEPGPHMSTKSALRADPDAGERKTLAEDRKRMECSSAARPAHV